MSKSPYDKMHHPSDATLDFYHYAGKVPKSVKVENVASHLEQCAGCATYVFELDQFDAALKRREHIDRLPGLTRAERNRMNDLMDRDDLDCIDEAVDISGEAGIPDWVWR